MTGCRSSSEITATQLIEAFHRELDTANACTRELELANLAYDATRVIAAVLQLHHAWGAAEAAVQMLGRRQTLVRPNLTAHNALAASRYFARDALARAWQVLLPTLRQQIATEPATLDHQADLPASTACPASTEVDDE